MRKIIRYASISWNKDEWKKLYYWIDPDTGKFRGDSQDEHGRPIKSTSDSHIMFVLQALQLGAKITYVPIEQRDSEPTALKLNRGFTVYVGNGFLYWDTDHEAK